MSYDEQRRYLLTVGFDRSIKVNKIQYIEFELRLANNRIFYFISGLGYKRSDSLIESIKHVVSHLFYNFFFSLFSF